MRDVEFPACMRPALETPKRYKIFYGGRGGGKSWNIARALIVMATSRKLRILCGREIMKSLAESVHELLCNQIVDLGLAAEWEITDKEIRCPRNGSVFIFTGLRFNLDTLKSKEGIDIVWVEEAATVSHRSWEKLIPTIRKPGSEIWVSFNPELDDDPTYERFMLPDPAIEADIMRIRMNYTDNPWHGEPLESERIRLKQQDPIAYQTVWEGKCRIMLEGSIFADQLLAATEQGRIGNVPWTKGVPVHTFWDLGWSDYTAIWFVQSVGQQFRMIDYFEGRRREIPDILKDMQRKPYVYGTHYLPHDAENELQVAAGRTIRDQVEDVHKSVEIIPRVSNKAVAIAAARTVFPLVAFDEKNTAQGINRLRRYSFKVDPQTGKWSRIPEHDDNSHAADAFEGFAMVMEQPEMPKAQQAYRYGKKQVGGKSWMAS